MPIQKTEEHASGDVSKDYCVHCTQPDGSMKSYEEVLESMAAFMVRTQGLDKGVAREAARAMMSKLPAWKEQ
jgi:hypothetical protein